MSFICILLKPYYIFLLVQTLVIKDVVIVHRGLIDERLILCLTMESL